MIPLLLSAQKKTNYGLLKQPHEAAAVGDDDKAVAGALHSQRLLPSEKSVKSGMSSFDINNAVEDIGKNIIMYHVFTCPPLVFF